VDTVVNRVVIERLWEERCEEDHLTGITAFKNRDAMSPEELLLRELDGIDLHHGQYSANPPYMIIEIFRVSLSEPIKTALSAYGFNEFHPGASGLRAVRPVPTV
jgi:hypothetical protein